MKLRDIKEKAGYKFRLVDDKTIIPYMILDSHTNRGYVTFVSLDMGVESLFGENENIMDFEVTPITCNFS